MCPKMLAAVSVVLFKSNNKQEGPGHASETWLMRCLKLTYF